MKTQESDAERAMKQFRLLRLSPYEAVQVFCELLRDELNYQSAHGLDIQALRRYYQNLFLTDGTPSPLGVYGYASRLAPALQSLGEAEPTVRLLDAGCGYGTESLLFALLGAKVTGVELVSERTELARLRRDFYQKRVSASLSAQFINADIIRYLKRAGPFDVIWIMEAISHIHPLEAFLPLAYQRLSPGGLLITSDPNALNPITLYRAYRIRGAPRYTLRIKARDPDSGAPVYEAVERIFSVLDYTRMLSKTGFEVRQVSMSGFLGASFVPLSLRKSKPVFTMLTSVQKILQTLPALRLMGTVYTVVAQKAACEDEPHSQRESEKACGS
jgi:2-polyprenyl-3-methyl-5-hydroxy-6-metoxy-1,4-benzoquinol methylase